MLQNAGKLLVVEDNPDHADLIRYAFKRRAPEIELKLVGTLGEAVAWLDGELPSLIITDLVLPDGSGVELLAGRRGSQDCPLIVMTSHGNEQLAVEAMKGGALDYVVKSHENLIDIPHIADNAIKQWGHIIERRKAEEALKNAHADLERRVQERTAELDSTNTELHKQMARLQETEAALRRSEGQSRTLSHRLITLMEQERARLARELHDELGQQLSTMAMEIEWLRRQEKPQQEHIATLASSLDKLHQEVRRLCRGLHPMIIDRLGVSLAIDALVEEFRNQTSLDIDSWLNEVGINEIPQDTAVSIYRIFQESMTNAIRHSGASSVKVRLRRSNDHIELTVSDDGSGFDMAVASDNVHGIGLNGMNERASICGGVLDITSEIGRGTTVCLNIPVSPVEN